VDTRFESELGPFLVEISFLFDLEDGLFLVEIFFLFEFEVGLFLLKISFLMLELSAWFGGMGWKLGDFARTELEQSLAKA